MVDRNGGGSVSSVKKAGVLYMYCITCILQYEGTYKLHGPGGELLFCQLFRGQIEFDYRKIQYKATYSTFYT